MYKNKNGFVSGAGMLLPMIRKLREHVEFEKFLCRVLKDDERTRLFKDKTDKHPNKLFAMRFNNDRSNALTAAGRKDAS